MQRKHSLYNPHAQIEATRDLTARDCPVRAPAQPVEPVADQADVEPQPAYRIKTGWVDSADRTRTWKLLGPQETKMAEITTKCDTQGMADFLNFVDKDGHLRALFLSRAESKSNGRGR